MPTGGGVGGGEGRGAGCLAFDEWLDGFLVLTESGGRTLLSGCLISQSSKNNKAVGSVCPRTCLPPVSSRPVPQAGWSSGPMDSYCRMYILTGKVKVTSEKL